MSDWRTKGVAGLLLKVSPQGRLQPSVDGPSITEPWLFQVVAKKGVDTCSDPDAPATDGYSPAHLSWKSAVVGVRMKQVSGTTFIKLQTVRDDQEPDWLPLTEAAKVILKRVQRAGDARPAIDHLVRQPDGPGLGSWADIRPGMMMVMEFGGPGHSFGWLGGDRSHSWEHTGSVISADQQLLRGALREPQMSYGWHRLLALEAVSPRVTLVWRYKNVDPRYAAHDPRGGERRQWARHVRFLQFDLPAPHDTISDAVNSFAAEVSTRMPSHTAPAARPSPCPAHAPTADRIASRRRSSPLSGPRSGSRTRRSRRCSKWPSRRASARAAPGRPAPRLPTSGRMRGGT